MSRSRAGLAPSPHFSPASYYGAASRALDCVKATDSILNVQEHASGRIAVFSLPGHDLRHLVTESGEKCGLGLTVPPGATSPSGPSSLPESWRDQPNLRGSGAHRGPASDRRAVRTEDSARCTGCTSSAWFGTPKQGRWPRSSSPGQAVSGSAIGSGSGKTAVPLSGLAGRKSTGRLLLHLWEVAAGGRYSGLTK